MNAPLAPGLDFDEETAREIQVRLSDLNKRIEAVRRALAEHQGCDAVQAEVFRLKDEVAALTAEVARAHIETCIDRCVRAGESTLAVRSLKDVLSRLLG